MAIGRTLLMAGVLALGPGAVAAAPLLRWLAPEYAPMTVKEGPQQGRGYIERALREVLLPGMPEFEHRVESASPPRVELEMRRGPNACTLAIRKTPARLQAYLFSDAMLRHLPVGIVLRRADAAALAPELVEGGEYQLARGLSQNLRLGVIGIRAHGPGIDGLLDALPQNLRRIQLSNGSQAVLTMLAQGHGIDAALAYDFEAAYFEQLRPDLQGRLLWMPLREQSESLLAFLACSRSPEGAQAVAAINRVLQAPGNHERIQAMYEEWLGEAARQRLAQLRARMRQGFWRE